MLPTSLKFDILRIRRQRRYATDDIHRWSSFLNKSDIN
ncbi:hypothetical protein DDI_1019 [Dickeya dianthicola RNS04.9]|nr:hypothetical protein DDI_1019 [Dickeya dianthicola RNS04.9]